LGRQEEEKCCQKVPGTSPATYNARFSPPRAQAGDGCHSRNPSRTLAASSSALSAAAAAGSMRASCSRRRRSRPADHRLFDPTGSPFPAGFEPSPKSLDSLSSKNCSRSRIALSSLRETRLLPLKFVAQLHQGSLFFSGNRRGRGVLAGCGEQLLAGQQQSFEFVVARVHARPGVSPSLRSCVPAPPARAQDLAAVNVQDRRSGSRLGAWGVPKGERVAETIAWIDWRAAAEASGQSPSGPASKRDAQGEARTGG